MIDTIFSAYFSTIPLDIFAALMAIVWLVEIVYTFTSNWDVL